MKLTHGIALSLLASVTGWAHAADAVKEPIVGLITKTETNPFFVKMKEGAQN